MEYTQNTDTAPCRNWQDLASEASLDHLTAASICILAWSELEQNGGSEQAAIAFN